LIQDLLENGCVRVRPALIWNRLGILVSSCEECLDHNCVKCSAPSCPSCHSDNIIKRGYYKHGGRFKQKFSCKVCGRKFVKEKDHVSKTSQEVIDFALVQVRSGKSFREVSKLIEAKYGIRRSSTAVLNWTKKPNPLFQ